MFQIENPMNMARYSTLIAGFACLVATAEALDCHVLEDGTPLDGMFTATLLAGDSPDAYNDIGHPDRV
jgi:hypothetical protein